MTAVVSAVHVNVRIPFHHCDPLFVAWHGRYLEYFELARTQLFMQYQLDVGDVRAQGFRMYVTDARCRYMSPLTYGDEARISAQFKEVRPFLRVIYDVRNLTQGRRSARGYTVIATTDRDGQLLPETPAPIVERIERGLHA